METFPIDFLFAQYKNNNNDLQLALYRLKCKDFDSMYDTSTVPVPRCKDWSNHKMNVRKIHFSKHKPDPVLVLGRSASNWLKWHNLDILPRFCDDVSTSDSSSDGASVCNTESITQEWLHKKSHVDEISFVPFDTFAESLSDDEDL
jgi:hypothetical protein